MKTRFVSNDLSRTDQELFKILIIGCPKTQPSASDILASIGDVRIKVR